MSPHILKFKNFDLFKKIRLSILTTVFLLLSSCAVNLQEYDAALVQSMLDRNANITATGYAVISVQKANTRLSRDFGQLELPKLDAYRVLMEQVYGLQLDSDATVQEIVIQNDNFRGKVQGVIYGAKLVSISPVGDDVYETTLSLSNNVVRDLKMMYATMSSRGSLIGGS